jgi:hypothetical protein
MGYSHGIAWNEKMVRDEILKVMDALLITRMPSRKEICNTTGNEALVNKISKTGGFHKWAEKLNIKTKDSATELGYNHESYAKLKLVSKMGMDVLKMSANHPYDFLVNGSIKVDVKCAKPSYAHSCRVHTFATRKKYASCDLYVLIALDERDRVEKCMIVPAHEMKVVTCSIGKVSVYDKYIDRWDYFEKFDSFYKTLSE